MTAGDGLKRFLWADTPLGRMAVAGTSSAVTDLALPGQEIPGGWRLGETPLLCRASAQLREYFERERTAFDLPLEPAGTPFQRQVWAALLEIPYGETRTYGGIAAQIGRPGAGRAVGSANHRNPIPIFIPCHRVIGAGGTLTGYAGGLPMKEALLNLERGL